ncbi:MAG: hypothetical protein AAB426_09220, partial [Myxococcota bacterium]
VNGNIGGRLGADAKCAASTSAVAICGYRTKVRAFLTVTIDDQLQSMPANFALAASAPITSLNGTAFATDWMAMFVGDGTGAGHWNEIPYSLATAGILPASTRFWSGTFRNTPSGATNATTIPLETCSSFTNAGSTWLDLGVAGSSSKTNAGWLSDGTVSGTTLTVSPVACNTSHALLCVCGR